MPIYEYSCKNCGNEWEEMQKITEDPISVCPSCNEPMAQRLISHTSFILKGSGWYVTDYGRGNGRGGEKSKPESSSEKKESSPKKESSSSKD